MTAPTPVFGYTPNKRGIVLSDGADFILSLVLQGNAQWPEDTQLRIEFGTHPSQRVWDAEVSGNLAHWKVEAEEADLVLDGTPYRMYVSYPDNLVRLSGPERTDIQWFYGKVKRTRS